MCDLFASVLKTPVSISSFQESVSTLEYDSCTASGFMFKNSQSQVFCSRSHDHPEILLKNTTDDLIKFAMGHTRHPIVGEDSINNTHPITDKKEFFLVHNGHIRNWSRLKTKLQGDFYNRKFNTETDSEVFLQMVISYMKLNMPIDEAMSLAYLDIDGPNTFVIFYDDRFYCMTRHLPLYLFETYNGWHVSSNLRFSDSIYYEIEKDLLVTIGSEGPVIKFQDGEILDIDFKQKRHPFH